MKGTGWECDQCKSMVLEPLEDMMLRALDSTSRMPRGWLVLAKAGGPEATWDTWRFCSWACAHQFTHEQQPKP